MRTALLCLALLVTGCHVPPPGTHAPAHEARSERVAPPPISPADVSGGDSIVICGRRVHTGAPVVLWTDPPYYDATREVPRFSDPAQADASKRGPRYTPGRARVDAEDPAAPAEVLVPPGSHDQALLAEAVDQFVLHYDVCGLSRTCFRVLQDERKLSVHFLLDLDGTIYQTMDLRDTAWHATKSNRRSIGVEIANMGAYPPSRTGPLDDWYARDALGTHVRIPERVQETGLRTRGFVARPARGPDPITGVVQGERLVQYDFTPEQYDSLVKLAATLCAELPRIEPDAPRDADGSVLARVLDDAAWRDFRGILGHYHVQRNKTDPGPAFDWETFLAAVRARMDEVRRAER